MTTALIPIDTLGATIRAHIEKGDASIEKAEQHYKSAGIHLAEAKERVKSTPGLTWPAFLNAHCQIRRRRADELIMIADGRTTLSDLRMKKAESVRAVRERAAEKPALRSAEPVSDSTEDPIKVGAQVFNLLMEKTDREDGLQAAEDMLIKAYYQTAITFYDYLGGDDDSPTIVASKRQAVATFMAEQIGFADIMMMVKAMAFSRLNDHFGSPEGVSSSEMSWRKHCRAVAPGQTA